MSCFLENPPQKAHAVFVYTRRMRAIFSATMNPHGVPQQTVNKKKKKKRKATLNLLLSIVDQTSYCGLDIRQVTKVTKGEDRSRVVANC